MNPKKSDKPKGKGINQTDRTQVVRNQIKGNRIVLTLIVIV